jgi:hypothetical protein
MTRSHEKLPRFDYYEGDPEGFTVYSWCPTPEPTVPPTQVHLHIPVGGGTLIYRFKSPRTLGRLIAALQEHRRDVWGEEPEAKPESEDT